MIAHAQTVEAVAFHTSLGWMALASRDGEIVQLAFGRRSPQDALNALDCESIEVVEPNKSLRKTISRLRAYADGANDDFSDVNLDLSGMTPFQQRVVRHCRRIPSGKTLSYAQLAAKAGSPRAARAVGNVMASNRFPLIVPCHRVVGSGGSLGGYSAPDGLNMKRRLLAREGSLRS